MSDYISCCVKDNEAGMRLDQFLASMDEIVSRAQAQRLLKSGNVLLNGVSVSAPSRKVYSGQSIQLTVPDSEPSEITPEKGELEILHEDSDVIVVNKPAGMVVHPSAGHASGTLVNYLMHHCNDLSGIGGILRPGIVHRLDKDTSGIIAAAKTDKAHRHLGKQFEERSVEKEYVGFVWGKWEGSGTMDKPIKRSRNDRTKYEVQDSGRLAKTDYNVLSSNTVMSIVHFYPKTGRTHQIRVHSEHAGHPIIGDEKYGGGKNRAKGFMPEVQQKIRQMLSKTNRHLLHAKKLSFTHPESGERVTFVAPVSDDMKRVIEIAESFDE
jgi:23S rRNA pseudouridine1911/1915/1917 synthase